MAQLSEKIDSLVNGISRQPRLVFVILAVLCLVAYGNSFDVPLYFDDFSYIFKNPLMQSVGGLFDRELAAQKPLYENNNSMFISRPFSEVTFVFNYILHQASVAGYHVFNLIVHFLNSCLVYLLVTLTLLLEKPGQKSAVQLSEERCLVCKAAFFSAAIFAVHPVMTNAVTYITQRMASIATLFYLLTLVSYARFYLSRRNGARVLWYLLAIAACFAAMKSKEIAFTLPFMLLIFDSFFCTASWRQRLFRTLPFLLVAALAFLTVSPGEISTVAGSDKPSLQQVVEYAKTAPGKYLTTQFFTNPNSTSIVSMSPLEYFYTQLRVVVTYQRMLLVPVGLNFVHDYPFYRSLTAPVVLFSLGFHLLILSLALYLFRRSGSDGRNAFMLRLAVFGIVWFYLALVMECGLIPMDDHFLEHRMYLPAFGFFVAAISLLQIALRRFSLNLRTADMFLVAIIILFAVLTVLRNEQWRDPLVFWQDALAKSPGKQRIHGYIGNVYRERGDMPKALSEYRLMLANDFHYGLEHFGLGEELFQHGFYREAVEEYLVALKIRPDKTFVYQRLAEAYHLLGDESRAEAASEKWIAGGRSSGHNPGVW